MKSKNGITLIALVITIVVLIILAGVAISLSIGENGIFKRAKIAKQKESESSVKERLELILSEAIIEKETNTSYNSEDYLTEFLEENDIEVSGDNVIIDNYNFLIDRENLVILESLGETRIKVTSTVQEYLGKNANDKYEASLLIVVESEAGLQSIEVQKPDGTTFEITTDEIKLGKDITVELDEEYVLKVTTQDGNTETRTIVEKSEEKIRTAGELATFRDKVNSGLTYEGKTITLTQDIDLSSVCGENINGEEISWEPIAKYEENKTQYFKGTFDGNNKTINNLYMNNTLENGGLFFQNEGTIDSLKINNGEINANYIGIIVVNNIGTISNVTIEENNIINAQAGVGGISFSNYGNVFNSINKADINAGISQDNHSHRWRNSSICI